MRVFVAGSSGQVALSLAEYSAGENFAVKTAGRPEFDLLDPEGIKEAIHTLEPDVIINAAAYTAVDAAEDDEEAATQVNATGAGALARIAHKGTIPFIHLSTDYVFDGHKDTPYTEEDYTRPTGAYGRSKLAGEIAVQSENPCAIILRTAWVYSPFGKNFVKTMLNLAQSRPELGVIDDQIGNPTYAPDIANAVMQIATHIHTVKPDDTGGIYHMAGTGSTSWHGFATEIFRLASHYKHPEPTVNAIPTTDFPTPALRPQNSQLDCSKLYNTFGIQLPSWQNSLENCIKRLFEEDLLG